MRTRSEGESETHASFWQNFVLRQFIGVWGERVFISIFGAWFFVAALCDVYISSRGGWNWLFLPIGLVPAGIGALLMLVAFGMRGASP